MSSSKRLSSDTLGVSRARNGFVVHRDANATAVASCGLTRNPARMQQSTCCVKEESHDTKLVSGKSLAIAFIVIWSHPGVAMSVKIYWAGHPSCSSSSPAFTVFDVPEGTVRLTFKMIDKNVPNYPHGGGIIAYEGKNEIPSGAFAYTGPCPPAGQQHAYEWTVRALDANGNVLASAVSVGKFPPR